MLNITEIYAENKIKEIIPVEIKGSVIEVIKRDPVSRLEHNAVFAVIFKHNKEHVRLMVNAAKEISTIEPKLIFSGSEVDEKFDMQNSAVFITAIIK